MSPSRPYIIRALNEWIIDNHLTPYVLIDATFKNVSVPKQYIIDGRIVLNIAPGAVANLEITNEYLCFDARFGGVLKRIFAPINAVLAIYAKENGKGMVFTEENEEDNGEQDDNMDSVNNFDDNGLNIQEPSSENTSNSPPRPPKKGKPNLKIIK